MSEYATAHFCVNCDEELSRDDRFWNDGCCPYCGSSKLDRDIVETEKRIYKLELINPNRRFWEFKKYKRVYIESE